MRNTWLIRSPSLKLLASAVTDGPAATAEIPMATQWQLTTLSFKGPELEEQESPTLFASISFCTSFIHEVFLNSALSYCIPPPKHSPNRTSDVHLMVLCPSDDVQDSGPESEEI